MVLVSIIDCDLTKLPPAQPHNLHSLAIRLGSPMLPAFLFAGWKAGARTYNKE